MEVGRDLLNDAPIDLGRVLVENVGQRMMAELDKVIISGDGVTQPQGILNASGLTNIGTPSAVRGPRHKSTIMKPCNPGSARLTERRTCRTSTSGPTRRTVGRGIPVNSSTDARRLFGLDEQSYRLFGFPFAIQNDMGNANVVFGAANKYRLYRRQGQEVIWELGGKELLTKNLALLLVRGRYGGKVMDSNAFCYSSTWKA